MTSDEWKAFLATWTHEIGERDAKNPNTKRTIDPTYGLGFPGATDSDIAAAEARLGTTLPRSYAEFLEATNGLLQPYSYVASYGGDFWPAADVDWFRARNSEWIDAYEGVDEGMIPAGAASFADQLRNTLELSHDGDSAVYLLNPGVIASDGEWEAWFFATWSPEVEKFPSFATMMRTRYQEFRDRGGFGF